ncbi:MAG: O-antigen ligase family protein [bacterium]|nr:O-antigen ligase family protein [bacterium]
MELNKYLKWTAIGALCAALFTPLIVADSLFFPFIVGKSLFFKALTEIALAAWLLLALRDSAFRPRISSLLWSFVAFTVVVALADAFGQNPLKSIWSNFERMEGLVAIVHVFAYFFVASCALTTERIWKRFLETSMVASALVTIYALFQMWGWVSASSGGARLDGTLGNATYLAVYMLFSIFIALILAYKDRAPWKRYLFAILAFLNFIILFNTGTRGAMLGLLGGLFVSALIIALFDKGERIKRIVAGSIVGAVVVLVLGFIAVRDADFIKQSNTLNRFATLSFSDAQNQARYYTWPMAIEGWKERPILGWGQENFNYVFNERYHPKLFGQEQWFDRAHNAPLDWLVAAGALGFVGYLSLFGFALWVLWRRSSQTTFVEKSLLTGLLAGYLFNNMFVFDNTVSYLMFASVLAYIHFGGTRLVKPVAPDKEEFDGADARVAAILIGAALIGSLYLFVMRPYNASQSLLDSLRAINTQPISVEAVMTHYGKALSYGTVGNGETIERMVESAAAVNASNAPIETKQKYYKMVRDAVEDRLERMPGDARYELFAGSFYATYGVSDKAEEHFKNTIELSPGKQTMYFLLGAEYIRQGRFAEAEAQFKTAYELDTNNTVSAEYYAASMLYSGKDAEARALLQSLGMAMNSDLFIQTYARLNKWGNVMQILQSRIDANPNDIQARQDLAVAYYQSGDKAMAIGTFREMGVLFPEYKPQADQYIRQIQAEL